MQTNEKDICNRTFKRSGWKIFITFLLILILLGCSPYSYVTVIHNPYSKGEMYRNEDTQLEKVSHKESVKLTHKQIMGFIEKHEYTYGDILDIGVKNPLGNRIEKKFGIRLDNTGRKDDFNYNMSSPKKKYDLIYCFNVIEHVPNVMTFLHSMKQRMYDDSILLIACPSGDGKLNANHYYEIPITRLKTILDDAGLQVEIFEEYEHYNNGHNYVAAIKISNNKFENKAE